MVKQNYKSDTKSYAFLKIDDSDYNINEGKKNRIYIFAINFLVLFLIILNTMFIYYIYFNIHNMQKLKDEIKLIKNDINILKYAVPHKDILNEISRFKNEIHLENSQAQTIRKLQKRHGSGPGAHFQKFHIHLSGGDSTRRKPQFFENIYVNWIPSTWSNTDHYTLSNGGVRVKQGGLYFIYAQICYSDSREKNGYHIYKNDTVIAQCSAIMLHKNETTTCYTAVVDYLPEGSVINVRDISPPTTLLFMKARSFFGLIQLTHSKL